MTYEPKPLGEYQRLLERFENINDGFILPDLHLVMRIDARRVGAEWERIPDGEYPFGEKVSAAFVGAARRLMAGGFRVIFAFVSGDEISLYFDPLENVNQRRRSKLISLIASAGAMAFYQELGAPVLFHAKLSELPSAAHVLDYFFWQRKVSTRNYYARTIGQILATQGLSPREVDERISGLTGPEQRALADDLGVPSAPGWKRLGSALWWEESGGKEFRLIQSRELPEGDGDFAVWIESRLSGSSQAPQAVERGCAAVQREKEEELSQKSPRQAKGIAKPFRIQGKIR